MNREYACPNCGGTVSFQSSIAVFAVCPYCRSMVVRHDVKVESIGQMAQLPPDLSPLQVGTQGESEGQGFTLVGRVRLAYQEGSWNEWCALFADERQGWVADAQGFFMVSFPVEVPKDFPTRGDAMRVGAKWKIEGRTYVVADCKETVCLGSEGELPFLARTGRKATSVDLTGEGATFASAEFSEQGVQLFVGHYARFEDLNFKNLRPVPGWSEDAPAQERQEASSLKCPNCGASVELRAAGQTMSATCGSCHSLLDTATPGLVLIREAEAKQRVKPAIPIGQRGELFGVNYEVIGFQHVRDSGSGWIEYLLFNPWHGFVWLVNYDGHWTFVRRLFEQPEVAEGLSASQACVGFEGDTYRIFAESKVATDYVVGEFYWKVEVGMRTDVSDFICPPKILSRESYPGLNEQTWSQGEYIEPKILEQAFGLQESLGEPEGTYLIQPNPYTQRWQQLRWIAPLVVLGLLVVQLVSAGTAAPKQVFSGNYQSRLPGRNPLAETPGNGSPDAETADTNNPPIVTPQFDITGGKQALEYGLYSPVGVDWLELDIELVNADSHQVVDEQVTELCSDEDGPADAKATVLVPGVPAGKYYLTITTASGSGALPFSVSVTRGVLVWSNFCIALALAVIYPVYCCWRVSSFERARWLESDFSSDDEDETS